MKEIISIIEIVKDFSNIIQGEFGNIPEFIDKIHKNCKSISDAMFFKTLEKFFKGLDENGTCARKIGEKLANSNFSEEYGFILLRYIDTFECSQKGMYLACLLDAVSKGFITVDDCFTYAHILRDVSMSGLFYIKNNVSNKVFRKENIVFNELLRFNLMYQANEGGYAFEMLAYDLDKFSLSYGDEKYKYNGESDCIPDRNEFPPKIVALGISQGKPY